MNEHLHTDEEQQYAYAGLQIAEAVGDGCQEEEHSTQAEDGEDVREEHHIRVERHREHSRNAVEREYQVAELYHEHRHEERGEEQTACLAYEEAVALKLCVYASGLREQSHDRILLHVHLLLLVAVEVHLHTTIYKYATEYQQHPVEAADYGCAEEDEHEAQHYCAEDAPVEHVLIFVLAHAERREYHHHHEQVVYRQRLFYKVSRDIAHRHIMAILLQTRLKVRRVELQVRSVRRRHGFKVGKVAYAVHHVALEP